MLSAEESKPTKDANLLEQIEKIKLKKDLPKQNYPIPPNVAGQIPVPQKLAAIQAYVEKLAYNYTGTNYFDVRKNRPLARIFETARSITRQALPIKCVEAVFLSAHLTQGIKEVERIPLAFKSSVGGQTYRHIVMAVKHNSKWGSLGLSRRRELYYKDLVFDSLGDLVLEFRRSYETVFHTVKRVRAGLLIPHEPVSGEYVCWNHISQKCSNEDMDALVQAFSEYGRSARRHYEQWKKLGGYVCGVVKKNPSSPARVRGSSGPPPVAGDGVIDNVVTSVSCVAGSESDSSDDVEVGDRVSSSSGDDSQTRVTFMSV